MKDIVLRSNLNSFTKEYELTRLPDSECFEHFVNYTILSRTVENTIEPFDIWCGDQSQFGIDGAAIVVNENIVTNIEEIQELTKRLRYMDAHFVFVQSKLSEQFDSGSVLKMFTAASDFFSDTPEHVDSPFLKNTHELYKHIYNNTQLMRRSPTLSMYFATTGLWKDDRTVQTIINRQNKLISESGQFSNVQFFCIDRLKLIDFYRQIKLRYVKTVTFDRHVTVSPIAGIKEAFIGTLPCKEYINLISDEGGFIQKSLFYDNIRDYQGLNAVNAEIKGTLLDDRKRDRFPLLNNGVTIVAKNIRRTGDKFTIEDFQIVNGCQTSHVLHANRLHVGAESNIVIKLIATEDADIASDIIRGTNWQTEVKNEAFASLRPFHKRLEQYFDAMTGPLRLYYERRSKQYESEDVEKTRVISFPTQLKCVLAVMLEEPHSTHRYYGELLSSYRERIFSDQHACAPYYVSALGLYTVEQLFRNSELPRQLRSFKFHLIMLVRFMVSGQKPATLIGGKEIEQYCEKLLNALKDSSNAKQLFLRAVEIVEVCLQSEGEEGNEANRKREFTQNILRRVGVTFPMSASVSFANVIPHNTGDFVWYNKERKYGFVCDDNLGQDIFFHVSKCKINPSTVEEGDKLKYRIEKNERGLQAVDVDKV